jgi:hypothetical protein
MTGHYCGTPYAPTADFVAQRVFMTTASGGVALTERRDYPIRWNVPGIGAMVADIGHIALEGVVGWHG